MNREILFRAKPCYMGGNQPVWVYGTFQDIAQRRINQNATDNGTLETRTDKGRIIDLYGTETEVLCDTLGQFTGMTDKNGVKIFEDDIVEVYDFTSVYASKYRGVVKMYRGSWCVEYEDSILDMVAHPRLFFDDFADRKTEVIGNIHDNSELLAAK